MTKMEEFKAFVRTKPSLIGYVKNGSMTWQKFYELWDLYGPNDSEWNKYPSLTAESDRSSSTASSGTTSTEGAAGAAAGAASAFGLSEIINMVKKIDMATVQKNLTGIQKAIGLVQEMTSKGNDTSTTPKDTYTPRPIYRKFED